MLANDAMDERMYLQLLVWFDLLWARTPRPGDRALMDQLMRLIEAFEDRRRMASSA